MGINKGVLIQKMDAKGYSVADLAVSIHMAASTFYRKLHTDGNTFTIGEMHDICRELNLSSKDACIIFLNPDSHKCERT